MDKPTCATCPYYHEETEEDGFCQRNPPRVIALSHDSDKYFRTVVPETNCGDFCGEHPNFPAYIRSRKAKQ